MFSYSYSITSMTGSLLIGQLTRWQPSPTCAWRSIPTTLPDDLASSSNDLTAHGILSSSKHVADWISKLWDNGRPVDPDWLRWDGILAQLTDQSEPCSRIITVSRVLAANMYEHDGQWVFGTAKTPVKTEQTSGKFT
jgi:hypothetical protein